MLLTGMQANNVKPTADFKVIITTQSAKTLQLLAKFKTWLSKLGGI